MQPNQAPPSTLCLFLPTWVGDACLATPTLRAVRKKFPNTRIVGVMRPVIRDVLQGAWGSQAAWLDECILYRKSKNGAGHSRLELVGELRRQQIDLALLLTNSLWSAAVTRWAGIRQIVGYNRDARGWLLSERVPVLREGRRFRPISAVDYYLQLAQRLGCDIRDRRMQLAVSPADRRLANELWNSHGFDAGLPTVVINSGAATEASRIWPKSKVQQLATRIATELGWQVLLHCGPGEREIANQVADEAQHPRVASMGRCPELPIGLSKAVLARGLCVVSTDSGPRHIAVALNRPVVALYGPTNPAWTTTYNVPEIAITAEPTTGTAARHMQDITVDRVLAGVKSSIAAHRAAA